MSQLIYVDDELADARARLEEHRLAPSDGRVADPIRWLEARDYLRDRVAELERRRDELLAEEDAA